MAERGRIAAEQGDFEANRVLLDQAIELARQHDVQSFLPMALVNLGDLAIEEGQLDEARALCEEGIALGQERGAPQDQVALINLAHVANLQGRHIDATDLGRQAFRAAIERGDRLNAAAAAKEIAWPLAELGKLEQSGWLLGAATAFTDNAKVTRQRTEVICEQAAFNALRGQLDEPRLEALLLQGRTMTLEDAAQAEFEAKSVQHSPRGRGHR
jgi:tetratricopeptide (TPR) repeat protein